MSAMNIGPAELLVVALVALIVLGPKRLPEAARQAGRALTEFKRAAAEIQEELRDAVDTEIESIDSSGSVPTPPAIGPTDERS